MIGGPKSNGAPTFAFFHCLESKPSPNHSQQHLAEESPSPTSPDGGTESMRDAKSGREEEDRISYFGRVELSEERQTETHRERETEIEGGGKRDHVFMGRLPFEGLNVSDSAATRE